MYMAYILLIAFDCFKIKKSLFYEFINLKNNCYYIHDSGMTQNDIA